MFKVGEKVKVDVIGYRLIGEIIALENEIAVVKIPVYYGQCKKESIVVKRNIKDLWKVIKDLEDYKKYVGQFNLR